MKKDNFRNSQKSMTDKQYLTRHATLLKHLIKALGSSDDLLELLELERELTLRENQ